MSNRMSKRSESYLKVINNRIEYLSRRVLTESGDEKYLNRMKHELNALCWVYELAERIRCELEEHESEVVNLNKRITFLNKSIDLIGGQCGLPDPGDACRAILKTVKELQK